MYMRTYRERKAVKRGHQKRKMLEKGHQKRKMLEKGRPKWCSKPAGPTMVQSEYRSLLQHLDSPDLTLRYHSDHVDVEVVKQWALRRQKTDGLEPALLGVVVMAHFNCVRTFGMVERAFRAEVDWRAFLDGLRLCGHKWGAPEKKKWAIYSPNCMSGSGMPAPEGKEYLERFPIHFAVLRSSKPFARTVEIIQRGIATEEQAAALVAETQQMRQVVKGMLGDYHYKMLRDFLTATQWLPPKFEHKYPVCNKGGTAAGLRRMFAEPKATGKRLSDMLDILTNRLRMEARSWRHTDHAGVVGAHLCWQKRKATAASNPAHSTRYHETTASWESDLADLHVAGRGQFWLRD